MKKRIRKIGILTAVVFMMCISVVGVEAKKKVSMYVITEAKNDNSGTRRDTHSFKYNSGGKITRYDFVATGDEDDFYNGSSYKKYKYDKKGRFKKKVESISEGSYYCYKYDKKGRVVKSYHVTTYSGKSVDWNYKYNKKGYLIKTDDGESFKYDKKGHIVKEHSYAGTYYLTYDKHDNLKTYKQGDTIYTFKNKYDKKGRLIKQNDRYESIWTYKYKKVSVPAKNVPMIKAQQRWILMINRSRAVESVPLEGWNQ